MNTSRTDSNPRSALPVRIWRFYRDGFREMTVGRTLWAIILLKVLVFFVIIRWLLFPDVLERDFDNDADRAAHVRHSLSHQPSGEPADTL